MSETAIRNETRAARDNRAMWETDPWAVRLETERIAGQQLRRRCAELEAANRRLAAELARVALANTRQQGSIADFERAHEIDQNRVKELYERAKIAEMQAAAAPIREATPAACGLNCTVEVVDTDGDTARLLFRDGILTGVAR